MISPLARRAANEVVTESVMFLARPEVGLRLAIVGVHGPVGSLALDVDPGSGMSVVDDLVLGIYVLLLKGVHA